MLRRYTGYLLLLAAARLWAAPETSSDSPGVTVRVNTAILLHRAPVHYPSVARLARVEGTVLLEVTLDAKANVADARVLSGPVGLRRACLESVLQWHFTSEAADSTRQVEIEFTLPPQANRAAAPDFFPSLIVLSRSPAGPLGKRLDAIEILGLPPEAGNQLTARLPVHVGDIVSQELADSAGVVVREFDEHLNLGFVSTSNTGVKLQIVAPGYDWPSAPGPAPATPGASARLRVSSDVMQRKLASAPPPTYPPLAQQAKIQGIVKLNAVIGKDGAVQNLTVLSGHPLLVSSALAAVKQWTYEPLSLNGSPVEVETEIDVNFTLPQ